MSQSTGDRKRLLSYLEKHLKDVFFSKHYGAYMMPVITQAYFAIVRARQSFSFSMPHGMTFQNFTVDREFDWLWSVEEMQVTRAGLFSSLEADYAFGKSFYEKYQKGFSIFDQQAKAEEKCVLEKLSRGDIVEHLLQLIDAAGAQGIGYTVDSLLTFSNDDWFRKQAVKYAGEQLGTDIVEALRAPTHRSFVNSYSLRLLEARCDQEKGRDITEATEQIVKDYYWVEHNYLKAVPKNIDQVSREIMAIIDPLPKYEEEKERIEKIKKQKQAVFKQIKATPLLKAFVQFADDCTFIQDCRKQAVLRLNHFNLNYLDRLADLLAVDRELTKYVMFYELRDFIKNPTKLLDIAKKRQQGCLTIFDEKGYVIFLREELKYLDLSNFFPDLSGIAELKGMTASPGKVTGTARIILGSDQFALFQPGDILITNQTTPDFVPLMKKAGAVVAEQGGITSHAAIVSRELGIPCIVGAKKAMSVFHDGDIVEVDTEQGIVKKLS